MVLHYMKILVCQALLMGLLFLNQSNAGSFWQLTDVHWDARYSIVGNPDQMCHQNSSVKTSFNNSQFGNYLCDSPWLLVKSSIESMKNIEKQPDFILWTGDNAPHTRDPMPHFGEIFNATSNITAELRKNFNNITIIPVLGNHDSFPKDDYPSDNKTFYQIFLEKSGWKPLLDANAQKEFEQGGYFSTILPNGLKVLSVNTVLYYFPNKIQSPSNDPANQFAWMKRHFDDARTSNQKVLIAAHVPPGFWERNGIIPFFNATYNKAYLDLIRDYSDVIMSQIFGHEHTDSFRLFNYDGKVSAGFLAPSVTPWFPTRLKGGTAINPSIRLYKYNDSNLLDYSQYHMNLSEVSLNNKVWGSCLRKSLADNESSCEASLASLWKHYYTATKQFSVTLLNGPQMKNYFQRISADDTLFQKQFLINSAGVIHPYCDVTCKQNHLCAISEMRIDDFYNCKSKSFDTPKPQATTVTIVVALSLTIVISLMLVIALAKRKRLLGSSVRQNGLNIHSGYRLLDDFE